MVLAHFRLFFYVMDRKPKEREEGHVSIDVEELRILNRIDAFFTKLLKFKMLTDEGERISRRILKKLSKLLDICAKAEEERIRKREKSKYG